MNFKTKAFLLLIISLLLTGLVFSMPVTTAQNAVLIKSSTIMQDLCCRWADVFMLENPGTSITVEGVGSARSIRGLLDGKCDMAASSRKISAQELVESIQKGIGLKEFYCGFAMYAVVVNPENPVSKLTTKQVHDIFTGKIKNWKEVGGADAPIDVIFRQINPGDYDHFVEGIIKLGKEKLNGYNEAQKIVLPMPADIAGMVSTNKNAISYLFSTDITKDVKTLAIKAKYDYIKPSVEDASVGRYPYLRPLYFYVNSKDYIKVKKFIDFVLSDTGAQIAKKMNFVPFRPDYNIIELIL
ncbi:MAG: phosphate ABC transporter substrate-binding protein [Armatimonadota bacterium]